MGKNEDVLIWMFFFFFYPFHILRVNAFCFFGFSPFSPCRPLLRLSLSSALGISNAWICAAFQIHYKSFLLTK